MDTTVTDKDAWIEDLIRESEQLKAQVARFRHTLVMISNLGSVCQHFEGCQHASCQSSYISWALATEALKEEL